VLLADLLRMSWTEKKVQKITILRNNKLHYNRRLKVLKSCGFVKGYFVAQTGSLEPKDASLDQRKKGWERRASRALR
jgi:hypothetical protein